MIAKQTTFYLVYWYAHSILKLGVTNHSERLKKHARTGATILNTYPSATIRQERAAIDLVGQGFDRAFPTAASAEYILGRDGSGFTECFQVPARHLNGAVELAYLGVVRGANEAN